MLNFKCKIFIILYLAVITGELNAARNHGKGFSMVDEAKPLDWKNFLNLRLVIKENSLSK